MTPTSPLAEILDYDVVSFHFLSVISSPKKVPSRKGEKVPRSKQEDADAGKGEEKTAADSGEAETD
ncbi:hypothetical protein ACRRTK_015316 [Alexandromys fortis]